MASKAGLINLTWQVAVEYAQHGIRANALCPGRLDDEDVQDQIRATIRWAGSDPVELADAALFLASDRSRYMTGRSSSDGGTTVM